jgi:ribosomal protein S18 acetylase RimI-like enzyme
VSPADIRVGALAPGHRARVREILDATGAFRPDEVDVALEVFDSGLGARPSGLGDADRADGQSTSPDYEFLGAYARDDTLAGYACFGPTPATDRTYDLYWIAVHPDHQRTGSGSILLREAEQRLRARGARLLVVETSSRDDYLPTRQFYLARGYGEAARVRDFYAPADDRIVYTKRFVPPSSDSMRSDLDE